MLSQRLGTAVNGGRNQTALRRGASARLATSTPATRRQAVWRRLPRLGPRALAAIAAILALGAGGWWWLRNSSLVAVQRVTVVGVHGPDAVQIRSALATAAHNMTTLNVNMSALRTAVAPFPVVRQLHVSTSFPHEMRIQVREQVPVAVVAIAGRQTRVAGDGTLLHDTDSPATLPTITLTVAPGGTHLTGVALSEVRLLAAAPYAMLAKISQASSGSIGLQVQLRRGPRLYFGGDRQLRAKWSVATAVLSDPGSAGADYIDVTDPARPAAGAGSDTAAPASPTAAGGSTAAAGGSTAAAGGSTAAAGGSTAAAGGSTAAAGGSTAAAGGSTATAGAPTATPGTSTATAGVAGSGGG